MRTRARLCVREREGERSLEAAFIIKNLELLDIEAAYL